MAVSVDVGAEVAVEVEVGGGGVFVGGTGVSVGGSGVLLGSAVAPLVGSLSTAGVWV